MDARSPVRTPSLTRVALLVASCCAVCVVSQFLRNSVGVIAPDLALELALSPESLGILSSAFFLSFAAAQIPLGVAIDRYGPKRCMLTSIGLAIGGCVLFAFAQSVTTLTLARVMMGLGCSSLLMAPLTIYTRWFRPELFSTLAGVQLGVATFGTLGATAPLAWSAALIGWRASFLFVAAIATLIGLAAALIVSDDPPHAAPRPRQGQSLLAGLRGLADVVRVEGFVPLFAMHLCAYGSFVTVLGLWGGPFLTDVFGFDLTERGDGLFILAAGHAVGMFLWGPVDRLAGSRKIPVTVGALATASTLTALALWGDRSPALTFVLFGTLGATAAYVPVLTAHGRSLFPASQVGRGMTMMNFAAIGGAFMMQAASGSIIGWFAPVEPAGEAVARPFAAYQALFGTLAFILVLAWSFYMRAEDRGVTKTA